MNDQNQQSNLLGKIAAYTEILIKDPNSTIFVSLAETYRKLGMYEDARRIIQKGLSLHPEFSPAHIVLGRIFCQVEEFDLSEQEFKRALELDTESLAALVGYARVKILLGQESAARELLLRARGLSPADPVINKLLLSLPQASALVDDEDIADEAEQGSPLVSSTLAELYLKQGLEDKALDVYRQLSAASPDDLTLRRKVRELESALPGADFLPPQTDDAAVSTEEGADSGETIVRQPEQATAAPCPAEGEVEAEEGTAPASGNDIILKTLNHWLENIQQRREHV